MEKKTQCIVIVTNFILFTMLIITMVVSSERKLTKYANVDISMYNNLWSVPRIGAITNSRNAEIKFSLYNEKLYGVCLYFYVEGDSKEGDITCTLLFEEDEIETIKISVKELFALMDDSSINAKEIVFENRPTFSGEYTLLLEGNGIDPKTKISFYGSRSTNRYVNYVNADYQNYNEILYSIETVGKEHPYIWAMAMILAVNFLISSMFYIRSKEKKVEITE